MQRTITSIIRILVFLILVLECSDVHATTPLDSLHLPYFVENGKQYFLHSTTKKHYIERELSDHIKHELPIARYDGTSFRFFVQMTIKKNGKVKRIKLLNGKSFKNNIVAWEDVKGIIQNINFHQATRGKPINYTLKFYVRMIFY